VTGTGEGLTTGTHSSVAEARARHQIGPKGELSWAGSRELGPSEFSSFLFFLFCFLFYFLYFLSCFKLKFDSRSKFQH
jgi:hypothetical protein